MSKQFDMELFLTGVLTGSHATRQRHLRQAKIIQAEITERWQRETPWSWQRKHVIWFLEHCLGSVRNPKKPNRRPLNTEIL
jgi:hypothetical protein